MRKEKKRKGRGEEGRKVRNEKVGKGNKKKTWFLNFYFYFFGLY